VAAFDMHAFMCDNVYKTRGTCWAKRMLDHKGCNNYRTNVDNNIGGCEIDVSLNFNAHWLIHVEVEVVRKM